MENLFTCDWFKLLSELPSSKEAQEWITVKDQQKHEINPDGGQEQAHIKEEQGSTQTTCPKPRLYTATVKYGALAILY